MDSLALLSFLSPPPPHPLLLLLLPCCCWAAAAEKRALFDQYGERGLKNGVPNGKGGRAGGVGGGYGFTANPEELFADHFGSSSPFADFFATSAAQPLFQTLKQTEKKKVAAQEINLYVSLEELYAGASKSHKLLRKRLGMDGRTLVLEEKILKLEIGAGWKEGTRLTFAREGDEEPGETSEIGDVVFVLRTKPHPRFVRRGNDLVYTAPLSLAQALTGTTLSIETLDRRVLPIALNEVCAPGGAKIVAGEGMPNPKAAAAAAAAGGKDAAAAAAARGNLVIEFAISFPEQLSYEQKQGIKKILGPTQSGGSA